MILVFLLHPAWGRVSRTVQCSLVNAFNEEEIGPKRRTPPSQHVNSRKLGPHHSYPSGLPAIYSPTPFTCICKAERGDRTGGKNSLELTSDLPEEPSSEEGLSRSSLAQRQGDGRENLGGGAKVSQGADKPSLPLSSVDTQCCFSLYRNLSPISHLLLPWDGACVPRSESWPQSSALLVYSVQV